MPNFFQKHPVASATFIGATGVAGYAGMATFHGEAGRPIDQRLEDSSATAFRAGLGVAGVAALGYGAFKFARPRVNQAGKFVQGQVAAGKARLAADQYALGALVSRGPEHEAHLASLGLEPMSRTRVAFEAYGRNTRLMAAGGAGAGLLIGSAYGHPIAGAAIGAGAGLAGKFTLGMLDTWKKAGKVPGLRAAGVLAASALLFAGVEAVSPGDFQGTAYATPDGSGTYGYSDSSVRDRMASMSASGDMVFGLNRGRHG